MFISLLYISGLSSKNIRSELTKMLARFYPQIQIRFVFEETLSIKFFTISNTVFLVACKSVQSKNLSVNSALSRILAKVLAIYSHALQTTRESPSEPVNLLRLFPTAVFVIKSNQKRLFQSTCK